MDILVSVKSINDRLNVGLRNVRWQVHVKGANTNFGTLFYLHRHVASTRRVITDENCAKPRRSTCGAEAKSSVGQFHFYASSDRFTIE
jgi:hypothetical protein